jgi:hypothetical protein
MGWYLYMRAATLVGQRVQVHAVGFLR